MPAASQILGSATDRCGSAASSAPPLALRQAATAAALLPARVSSPAGAASGSGAPPASNFGHSARQSSGVSAARARSSRA